MNSPDWRVAVSILVHWAIMCVLYEYFLYLHLKSCMKSKNICLKVTEFIKNWKFSQLVIYSWGIKYYVIIYVNITETYTLKTVHDSIFRVFCCLLKYEKIFYVTYYMLHTNKKFLEEREKTCCFVIIGYSSTSSNSLQNLIISVGSVVVWANTYKPVKVTGL